VIRANGLVIREHVVEVPLDHLVFNSPTIEVFAREVAEPDGLDKPFLVYLQGGPGFEAPRPTRLPSSPGWLERALQEYRVLMLDQRGTGRSTPVGPATLPSDPQEQADYLKLFRADSIVRDCELVRRALEVDRWSVLGQSFGGFCVTSYLSLAPEGLREAFITGGLPPLGSDVDLVYRATFERMLERNRRYYDRYPGDRERVRDLMAWLDDSDVRLPSGDRLTSRRMRTLGNHLGMSDGFEKLHYILELPFDSPAFLHDAETGLGFQRNPIYAVIHEACYADGVSTRWSAERVMPAAYGDDPTLLTGEHVFPWLFEDYAALRPLREAASLLAEHEWPRLYNPDVLAANEVPAAAAVYANDLYVERRFSEETAAAIRGLRPWVTNEYEHNGIRADGARVLGRLIDLARGHV
jgi:pimeloyl-ACP methyl ester carboxylesterase